MSPPARKAPARRSGKAATAAAPPAARAGKPAPQPAPRGAKGAARRAPEAAAKPRFTVFLDRDGVFNVNPPLGVRLYRNLEWLPGAREAFARLNRPGIQTSLATNQPWVGLGTATPSMIRRLHARFRAELERHGGRLDHVEAAYANPLLRHRRTKPNAGMLEDGAKALAGQGSPVDRSRAVMVGDKLKDAQAAAAFGIPCILLATTYSAESLEKRARLASVPYAAIVPDLGAAVDLILAWAE